MALPAIGFIGVGTMGFPMARNLIAAGYPVKVYDLLGARIERAVDAGASAADSSADAASGADVVITMVPSSPNVEDAVLGPNGVLAGARPGTIYIDMSTILPGVSRNIGAVAEEHGVRSLDAPVSRGYAAAVSGNLVIMVGGEAALLDEVRPILGRLGSTIIHCGPRGMGAVAKLVNNLVIGSIAVATNEALVFGVKSGARLETLLEVLSQASGNSWLLENFMPKIFHGDFSPGFFVDHMHKDLSLALTEAGPLRLPLPMAAASREIYSTARAKGYGEDDFCSVLRLFEELAGVEVRTAAVEPSTR